MPQWHLPPLPSQGAADPSIDPVVEAIGRDLRFSEGEVQIKAASDYDTVAGLDYARQWILNCLITVPGSYRLRPNYGVGVLLYLKKTLTTATLSELRARCREALTRNPLFERIDAVPEKFVASPGRYGIKIIVTATIAGREHTFEPFQFTEPQ